ncbi:MAG TPA: hypothetical protein VGG99_16810 [Acetobacteraceae bacterium]|jgi:hypothetical protein
MRCRLIAFAAALVLAGCTAPPHGPSQSVAEIPQGFFNNLIDPDLGCVNESSYSFGSPNILHGNPAATLRATICVEYLAAQTNSPRWTSVPPLTQMQLPEARDALRRVVGIAPNAPPPLVVNTLLRLLHDLQVGNMMDARAVIAPPLFTMPPDQTLAVLTNLPPVPIAHVATQQAELEAMRLH